MPERIPHAEPAKWPDIAPGRFAATSVDARDPGGCAVALLGLPDDLGVRLNRGRPGAAEGPAAFRAALARYGSPFDSERQRPLRLRVFDAGDVRPGPGDDAKALRETHRRIAEAVTAIHQLGLLPVCIGGGHDLTYASLRALAAGAAAPLAGINFDAHLDVREEPGSGMPFRSLISEGCLEPRRFSTLGVGAFASSQDHAQWLARAGGALIAAGRVMDDPERAVAAAFDHALPASGGRVVGFVSLDLDAIDAAFAPGVSALNPAGLSPAIAIRVARKAGRHPRVQHFDVMELSPPHDEQGRTARLAAHLFLSFLAGLDERLAEAAP